MGCGRGKERTNENMGRAEAGRNYQSRHLGPTDCRGYSNPVTPPIVSSIHHLSLIHEGNGTCLWANYAAFHEKITLVSK